MEHVALDPIREEEEEVADVREAEPTGGVADAVRRDERCEDDRRLRPHDAEPRVEAARRLRGVHEVTLSLHARPVNAPCGTLSPCNDAASPSSSSSQSPSRSPAV